MTIVESLPLRRAARRPIPRTNPTSKPTSVCANLIVKIHPDLALAALGQKCDRQYRFWTLARAVDLSGRGRVPVSQLRTTIEREQLKGLSRTTLARILKAGEGVFWTVHDRTDGCWLYLRSLARVCLHLGVERLRYDPAICLMPQKLKGFRAVCAFGPFAGDHFSRPLSQKVLADLTGLTDRTLRNYAKDLGDKLDSRPNAARLDREWKRGDSVPDGHYPDFIGDSLELLQVLPNSYRLNLRKAARGMIRKVNRFLGANSPSSGLGEQQLERLYYAVSERRAVQRRMQARQEGDTFYLLNHGTCRSGARLWTRYQFCNAQLFTG